MQLGTAILGPPRGGRMGAWATWILVGAWGVWAVVRLAGLERGFPLVPLLAYTPYVAVAAVLPLAVALMLRRLAPALAAACALLALAAAVLPRTLGDGEAAATGDPRLRVLSTNLEFGEANPRAVAGLARALDVDVLAAQELTPASARKLRRSGLEGLLPHTLLQAAPGASGGGLYSRLPLDPLPADALPGGFQLPRAVLRAGGASEVEVASVHTVPPTRWGEDSWDDDLGALPATAEEPYRVLAGDFNATLDHAELRDLLERGYEDAADELGEGLLPTWPHGRVFPPPVTIDHVLFDERIGARDYSVHDVPGSDHRAVFAELILPPARVTAD